MFTNLGNQKKEVRTLEQICNKTDQILAEAHELENATIGTEYKVVELNRLLGQIESLQWVRYMSQELN
jgi:hypothetical protein